jgi:hypothetical protein
VRVELFPWQDPLTGWEPFDVRFLLRGRGLIDLDTPFGADDQAGAQLEDARMAINGELADGVRYRFSLDAGDEGELPSGDLEILEGWAAFELGERQSLTMGRFRRPFLRSSIVDQSTLLFFDRTAQGDVNNVYDEGARVDGAYEWVDLTLALQSGVDGTGAEGRFTARADVHLLGGGVPLEDAPYREAPEHQLSVGLAYADETGVPGGEALALDAAWRFGRVGLAGEFVDASSGVGDGRPFALTASWLPLPQDWAVGARYQDLDDAEGRRILSIVAKRYLIRGRLAGHLQVDRVEADDKLDEGWRFTLGTTLSF